MIVSLVEGNEPHRSGTPSSGIPPPAHTLLKAASWMLKHLCTEGSALGYWVAILPYGPFPIILWIILSSYHLWDHLIQIPLKTQPWITLLHRRDSEFGLGQGYIQGMVAVTIKWSLMHKYMRISYRKPWSIRSLGIWRTFTLRPKYMVLGVAGPHLYARAAFTHRKCQWQFQSQDPKYKATAT